jgi:membrane associated rhomboid family serine protease
MIFTIVIIVVTVLVSLAAFNNGAIINKLILYPGYMNNNPKEYYRFLTSGFIHADLNHLFFNMFTMFAFGRMTEEIIGNGNLYLVMYLSAIIISSLPAYFKNRNNSYYRALGASGGVSAVLFFVIYYLPWSGIRIMFIPINIPAIIFGGLYIAYCVYMSKRGNDNIGHDAHLLGSLYGLVFALILDPSHGLYFVNALMHPTF